MSTTTMISAGRFGACMAVLLLAGTAVAADQQILGKRLFVNDPSGAEAQRMVIVLGKETATDVGPLTAPTTSGATLRVVTNGTTASDETFVLDPSGWVARGNGYRYAGPTGADGDPVKKVLLERTPSGVALLKVILNGRVGTQSLDVVPPNSGTIGGIILDVTGGDRYCVAFGGIAGGRTTKDSATQWKVVDATAQPGCEAILPCTDSGAPTCGGTCPAGQFCAPFGGGCYCAELCGNAPACGGSCPNLDQECVPQGDGCLCAPTKLVFVTSGTTVGAIMGTSGADALCNVYAGNAGLPGSYLAWISDPTTSPSTRFTHATIPYVEVDGTVIANDWTDLTDGSLATGITVTENGTSIGGEVVWTGTSWDGTYASPSCGGWFSPLSSDSGVNGITTAASALWSLTGTLACNTTAHLYCFQQ